MGLGKSAAFSPPRLRSRLLLMPAPEVESERLSAREIEILNLLVKGLILKEVADQLGIGLETVRTHVSHIYQKLHVRSRTEAVVKYLSK